MDAKLTKSIILSLSAIIFLALFTLWLGSDISSRSAAVLEGRKNLVQKSEALRSLAALKLDSERAKSYSSLLQNILPLRDQLISFPKDLEGIARKNKVDFGFSFGAEVASKDNLPGSLGFAITLGGKYANILDFMEEVESSRYIIEWVEMDIALVGDIFKGSASGRVFSR